MVTKLKKSTASSAKTQAASPPLTSSVKDSAQQIWQAGLGAFAKAQAEGTRAFEALVKEGTALQRKTQAAAEDRITEATSRMTNMANDLSSKASGQWDKLENIFEERVAKALNKLGVPSAKDISALIARIDALNQSVQKLTSAKAQEAVPVARKAATRSKAAARAETTASTKPARARKAAAHTTTADSAPAPTDAAPAAAIRRRKTGRPSV